MTDAITARICSVAECLRLHYARGYCEKHYQRMVRHGDPLHTSMPDYPVDRRSRKVPAPDCAAPDCQQAAHSKGYCEMHHQRIRRRGSVDKPAPFVCSVDGCKRRYGSGGYCQMHKKRIDKYGDPGPVYAYPPKVYASHEYIFVSVNGKQVMEHRYVMSQIIGRPLKRHENVHHINGDKHDNRPENLELWSSSQPPGQRIPDKVAYAVELLKLYAPELLA